MSRTRLSAEHNWILLSLAAALSGIGLLLIYSAEQTTAGAATQYWQFQTIWLFVALAAYVAAGFLPLRWYDRIAWPAYAIGILLLMVVLAFPAVSGARSWIRFGGIGFQPSEFAKLAAILVVARWAATLDAPPRELSDLKVPAALLGVPALLTLAQPDLGTMTVFVVLLAGMCFWAGASPVLVFLLLSPLVSILLTFSLPLWSVYIVGVGLLLIVLNPRPLTWAYVAGSNLLMGIVSLPLWNSLAGYQQRRLLVFLQPELDPRGAGWNVIQSKVAIGSGGWLGKGFLEGTQKRLAFLPERHTDFIFSVLGEEFGYLGIAVAFVLFALLLVEGVRIAERSQDPFGSTLAFGLVVLIGAHVAINTAMTVGLMPITGLPLPFLSKGGSFLLVCFVAVALLRVVWSERSVVRRRT
ncbi:MAG: rod shape-determining protein RodA [Gemmatimonadota bacterium]|nr:rod shape-determining protein RodA [Gemmatimonadota bacterium]